MVNVSAQTILVIDDDPVVRDSLKALLEVHRFDVAVFESGEDFLRRRPPGPAGCMLLDIHMPEIDGLDLLKRLREQGDTTPVVLITGRRDRKADDQAKALGAIALMEKPLAHFDLFAVIRQALTERTR